MPEARVSSLTAAIYGLLEKLPQVEHINLCPSSLALAVLRRLRDHSELCPGLRDLEVMVTDETCEAAVELVAEMVEGQAGCGNGRNMRRVGCSPPTASQRNEGMGAQVVCNKFWDKFGLDRYVSSEYFSTRKGGICLIVVETGTKVALPVTRPSLPTANGSRVAKVPISAIAFSVK
jgi:hypothetical protein